MGFFDDMELVMKLGQIALIAFIVLAVIIVAFLLMMCCMYCPTLFGGRNQQGYENQQNYYPNNIGRYAKTVGL